MSRYTTLLTLVVILFTTRITPLSAQEQRITTQDTLIIRQLLDTAQIIIKTGKQEEAIEKIKLALALQQQLFGENDASVAKSYHTLGECFFNKSEYDTALNYYQKERDVWLKLYGEQHEYVANYYTNAGDIYAEQYNLDLALAAYNKSLEILHPIYGESQECIASAYFRLGKTYQIKRDYKNAIYYLKKALDLRLNLFGENNAGVADALFNLASAEFTTGNYDQALSDAQKALELYIYNFGVNHSKVAFCDNNLGIMYQHQGDLDAALTFYQKALDIRLQLFGKKHRDVAASILSIGTVYLEKSDYKYAQDLFKQALDIYLNTTPQDLDGLKRSYKFIGTNYLNTGNYDSGILYLEKALELVRKIHGEKSQDVAGIYNNIGLAYMDQDEDEKALPYFEKALAIFLKVFQEEHWAVALVYSNIGLIYKNQPGNHLLAQEYLEKALHIYQKKFGEADGEVARCYYNLGAFTEDNLQDQEQAFTYYNKALNSYKAAFGEYHEGTADSYIALGNIDLAKHEYDIALLKYKQALVANRFQNNQYDKVLDFPLLIKNLHQIGNAYLKSYSFNKDHTALLKAREYYIESLKTIDYLRSTYSESGSKQFLLHKNYTIYENLLKTDYLLYQQTDSLHYLHEAFRYAEHAKSQLLYEGMQETAALHFAGLPDSLLQRAYELQLAIAYQEKRKAALIEERNSETDSTVLAVSNKAFDLKQQYESLKHRFETQYPDYYRLKYDLGTASVEATQQELLQGDQAMLEYFVGDSSIFIFVLRPDTLVMQELKKDFPLEDWVQSLRENIYQNRTTGASAYAEAAYNLYQKLILPVKSLLPEQIIIIPDGILGYVPFEALLTAKPERAIRFNTHPYLLKEYQISYCYSATLLREMQQKRRVKAPSETLLAVAPFYTGDTTLLAGLYAYDATTRKDLAPLKYSGEEAYRISKLWNGDVMTGTAATEAAFAARAGDYRILHLATHGRADERVGDYSFLAFSEIKDSAENELLYVRDLYNMQLNADMVVLSACETGLGKLSRGEGILSLARAFAYAGAKSIVTTLWSVDDAKTKDLMVDFYKKLRKGMRKDAALRQAKLEYLAKQTTPADAHPYYWAGFAPIGDMRALQKVN